MGQSIYRNIGLGVLLEEKKLDRFNEGIKNLSDITFGSKICNNMQVSE